MKRRFQVFISSTYEDLKVERQSAIESILKAGHIPAGMELFTAGDKSQMDVIRRAGWACLSMRSILAVPLLGRFGTSSALRDVRDRPALLLRRLRSSGTSVGILANSATWKRRLAKADREARADEVVFGGVVEAFAGADV
jgi:hypothetical protein